MAYHTFGSVIRLIRDDAWVLATRKCRDDVLGLGFTSDQLHGLLCRLKGDDFIGEFGGKCTTDFGEFDGDSYVMWIDTSNATRCPRHLGLKVYLKLAIRHDDEAGDDLLVISFHKAER